MPVTFPTQASFPDPPDESAFTPQTFTRWARQLTATLTRVLRPLGELSRGYFVGSRFHAYRAGDVLAADVAFSAGWGTPTGITISGNDQRGRIAWTSGTVGGAPHTITLTFHDGAWPTAPFALVLRNDAATPVGGITWSATTTTLTITFNTAPNSTTAYALEYHLWG